MASINTATAAQWGSNAANGGLAQAYNGVNTAGQQYNGLAANLEHNTAAAAQATTVRYTATTVSFGEGTPRLEGSSGLASPQDLVMPGSTPTSLLQSTPLLTFTEGGPVLTGDLSLAPGTVQLPSAGAAPTYQLNTGSAPQVTLGSLEVGPAAGGGTSSLQVPTAPTATEVTAQLVGVQTYAATTADSGMALVISGALLGAGGG